MEPKWCAECKAKGVLRAAHRVMPGGRPLCDEHYKAEAAGLPAPDAHGLTSAARTHDVLPAKPVKNVKALPADWARGQRMRDAGMSAREIAQELGVLQSDVYNRTAPPPKAAPKPAKDPDTLCKCGKPARHRGRCKGATMAREGRSANQVVKPERKPSGSPYSDVLAQMKDRLAGIASERRALDDEERKVQAVIKSVEVLLDTRYEVPR
jgi:hypothetical protein